MANYFTDRSVENPGRYRLTPTGTNDVYDLTREEGAVYNPGTPLNAENLNDAMQEVIDQIPTEADYVIEQGTNGNWYYRKWTSGYMEATLRMSYPTIGSATALNGVQRMPINYPTPPTFNTITDVTASGHNSGAWVSAGIDGGGSVAVYLMRISGSTNALANFCMSLKGTWK